MTGFLLVNKPKDISSFACVARVRKLVGGKVGHAGTLDKFATGLLLLAIGRTATRELDAFINLDKTYTVHAKLGELTDTLDYTGAVMQNSTAYVTHEQLAQAFAAFPRTYTQTPPIYSALKHNGRPLYHLARYNKLSEQELHKIAEQKKRTVSLHDLTLGVIRAPFFDFTARVSKGTYIRSLANDIAHKLGTVATTYELERTAIGPFNLCDAITLADLETADDVMKVLLPLHTTHQVLG